MTVKRVWIAALVSVAGVAAPVWAQDSVSSPAGLPGDALDPYAAGNQIVNYVVDLVPLTTSQGREFGIAPLVKASQGDPLFFNHLMSAQAVSRTLLRGVPFPQLDYAVWDAAGAGVNSANNTAPLFITPAGQSDQFAVAFNEFGGTSENIVGAMVNVDPQNPNRLYVRRTMVAQNGTAAGEAAAALGGVSVDSNGNVHFRADGFVAFGSVPPAGTAVIGTSGPGDDNIMRSDMSARSSVINLISDAGGADAAATARLLTNSLATTTVPSIIPENLAGRPVYVGPDFNTQYVVESIAGVAAPAGSPHLAGLPPTADHRGSFGVSEATIFPGSVATVAGLTKSVGAATDTLSVWGVDANGGVTGAPVHAVLPIAGATDPIDAFTYTLPIGDTGFDHYHSQTPFRGGVGQVAVGQDAQGRGMAAAVGYIVGGNTDPSNALVVTRFAPGGAVEWSVAGWADGTIIGAWPEGKPVLDAAGAAIGELTTLDQVTGGSPFGPSFSAAGMDSAGNLWFLAPVQIYVGADDDAEPVTIDATPPTGDDIYTTGLFRAIYDEAAFGYRLELVLRLGDTFLGANSATPYTVTFLGIADSNSISSGTFFSGNVMESPWTGAQGPIADTADPANTGGVVINAEITYTTDSGVSEDYNTLLFVSPIAPAVIPCPEDINGDGVVNGADISNILNAFGNAGANLPEDINGDGVVNGADISNILNAFGPCPS